MMDCLFCGIVSGAIPARKLFEDDLAIAIHDINPQAPAHVLVIPKKHVASLVGFVDEGLLGHLLALADPIARLENLVQGYRTVINTGADGGQTVDHLHLHVLGGRSMHWPPG